MHFIIIAQHARGANYAFSSRTHAACLYRTGCRVVSDRHQRTLLMQASLHGHLELVRHLVNFSDTLGFDVQQIDADGRNALFDWSVASRMRSSTGQWLHVCAVLLVSGFTYALFYWSVGL